MLRLTVAAEAMMRQQINIDDLPTTFSDAVEVARRLKIRHLWIDALCIIQDSEEDWQIEARKMTDVYSNSVLNIAASAAEDCEGGLFSKAKREPLRTLPLKIGSISEHRFTSTLMEQIELNLSATLLLLAIIPWTREVGSCKRHFSAPGHSAIDQRHFLGAAVN